MANSVIKHIQVGLSGTAYDIVNQKVKVGTTTFDDNAVVSITGSNGVSVVGATGTNPTITVKGPSNYVIGGSQTTTSSADGGSNVFTFNKSDGTSATFTVKNGSKGSVGAVGPTGATGKGAANGTLLTNQNLNDYHTEAQCGWYYAGGSNTVKNKPGNVDAFGMWLLRTANGYYTQELYGSNNSLNRCYMRTYTAGSWTTWVEKGATGPKGDKGATGDKGSTGATGPTGPAPDLTKYPTLAGTNTFKGNNTFEGNVNVLGNNLYAKTLRVSWKNEAQTKRNTIQLVPKNEDDGIEYSQFAIEDIDITTGTKKVLAINHGMIKQLNFTGVTTPSNGTLASSYNLTLPQKAGTLALTSDIDVTAAGNNTFTGTNTYTFDETETTGSLYRTLINKNGVSVGAGPKSGIMADTTYGYNGIKQVNTNTTYTYAFPNKSGTFATTDDIDVTAAGDNTFTGINTFKVDDIDTSNITTDTVIDESGLVILPITRSPGREAIKIGWGDTLHNEPMIIAKNSSMITRAFKFNSSASTESGVYSIATTADLQNISIDDGELI